MKPKEKAKFEAQIDSSSQRLGVFTQSFGIGILPLFKEDNSPLFGDVLRTAVLDKIVRLSGDITDETLFKNIKPLLAEKFSVSVLVSKFIVLTHRRNSKFSLSL